jgi:hypothetical protein
MAILNASPRPEMIAAQQFSGRGSVSAMDSPDSKSQPANSYLGDLGPLFKKLEELIAALKNSIGASAESSGASSGSSSPSSPPAASAQLMPASTPGRAVPRAAPPASRAPAAATGTMTAKFPNAPTKAGTNAASDSAVLGGMQGIRSRYGKYILPQEAGAKPVAFDANNGGAAGLTQMHAGREGDKITLQPIQDPAYRKHVAAHEYVHSVTSATFAKSFNNSQLEGITDLMAQNVTGHEHSVYSKERAAAKRVQSMVGEQTMAKAIFSGDAQAIAKVKAAFASISS